MATQITNSEDEVTPASINALAQLVNEQGLQLADAKTLLATYQTPYDTNKTLYEEKAAQLSKTPQSDPNYKQLHYETQAYGSAFSAAASNLNTQQNLVERIVVFNQVGQGVLIKLVQKTLYGIMQRFFQAAG